VKTFQLGIEGLKGSQSKRTAESALVKVDGVYSATVSPKEGTAVVTARDRVEGNDLVEAVSGAGFEAEIVDTEIVELTGAIPESSE